MIAAREALERLREGNQRLASGLRSHDVPPSQARRAELLKKQEPFAIVLGCSDSRVPVEMVFDQGLGDLFVIRVAGNIVAPSQLASVEFAAARLGTRLVVVLGHSRCGAIRLTLEELQQPSEAQSRTVGPIVECVRSSAEGLLRTEPGHDIDTLMARMVTANIDGSVNNLRHDSEVLKQLIHNEGLLVVGAKYSLETGVVEFFDGAEAA